jgi:uncharacterized membrane protein YesL
MAWDLLMLALRLLWRRVGLLLLANLLWLGLSLLVVTWPAATAGLFYLARRVAEEELAADPQPATIDDFWIGFRQYWRRSSILAIGDLAGLALIVLALRFYGESTITPLSWLVGPISLIGLAWAGAQFYIYPLLIQRSDTRLWLVTREAFLMAISYPLNTYSLLLTTLILSIGATILAGPILLIFFSFIAILQTIMMRAILAQRGEIALKLTPEQRDARDRVGKPR